MSYIGTRPTSSFASATSQTFTGNNSLTEFTLNRRVSAPEDLEVFVSNVQQQPTASYTIGSNGLTLTFSEAPPSGQFYVVYRSEAGTSAIDVGAARTANANTFSAAQTFSGGLVGTTGTFSGALSGTTGTFSSAFTSPGIDDNANATAITIDSAENVGIGTTPETGHHANWTAVDIGNRGGLAQYKTVGDVTLTYNLYHDGAWKAKETAPSARYAIGAGPYHIWYTGASASADGAVTLTERMRISDAGNVGINTTSPGTKLQIVNDTDTDYNISTATTNAVLNLKNNTAGANNSVGMSFSTESNGEWYLTAVQEDASNCAFRIGARTGGSRFDRLVINSDGTVGIGTEQVVGAWALRAYNNHGTHASVEARNNTGGGFVFKGLNANGSVSSSITQSGVGYFANGVSSDQTLKNVKGTMNDGWNKLKDVQPKSFTWKNIDGEGNKSNDDLDGNIHYGVMAQDLKKIIPDLAYGEEGGMSVDYNGLLMVAINTIKELEARIKALESK